MRFYMDRLIVSIVNDAIDRLNSTICAKYNTLLEVENWP